MVLSQAYGNQTDRGVGHPPVKTMNPSALGWGMSAVAMRCPSTKQHQHCVYRGRGLGSIPACGPKLQGGPFHLQPALLSLDYPVHEGT